MDCSNTDYDETGRSLIIYNMGLFCWGVSIDGRPLGRSFTTRGQAIHAAQIELEKRVLNPNQVRYRRTPKEKDVT